MKPRRSSVTTRLAALTDIGGVNSIRSFARSFQRAAGFAEVIPQRPSFVFAPDQAPVGAGQDIQYSRNDVESARPHTGTSLLRQHFESGQTPETAVEDPGSPGLGESSDAQPYQAEFRDREHKSHDTDLSRTLRSRSDTTRSSIFAVPPHLATPPLIGSYGSYHSYGTIDSGISQPSMAQAAALWRQQQESGVNVPDGELATIMVKEVEEDGKIILTVEGQSTLPQTVFNSIKLVDY